jgi:hypothetical protein
MLHMSVDCSSSRYKNGYVYAVAMLLVFPLGIPFLYGCLLWKHRHELSDDATMERERKRGWPKLGHLKFLVAAYAPKMYLFEVFECIRRLLLGSIVGLVSPNSAASAVFGSLFQKFLY